MTADLDTRLRVALAEIGTCVRDDGSPAALSTVSSVPPRVGRTRAFVVAAVAIAVVVGIAIGIAATRWTTAPVPPPATRPTPTAPAIGFTDVPGGRTSRTVDVWTWNGRRAGSVETPATTGCCDPAHLSPNGTRVLIDGNVVTPTRVLDRRGHVLAQTRVLGGTWADDSLHLCAFQPRTPLPRSPLAETDDPADLVVFVPGGPSRVYPSTLTYAENGGPHVLRCSVVDGTALVGESSFGGIIRVVSIDLRTGRASTPAWLPRGVGSSVVAVSGSGRYALIFPTGNSGGDVVDTRTGRAVGHVSGQPEAISWDGGLVLQSINASCDLEVLDWHAHRVVWRSAHRRPYSGGTCTEAETVARPHSDDLALTVNGGLPGLPDTKAQLWLVSPTRPPLRLATIRQ